MVKENDFSADVLFIVEQYEWVMFIVDDTIFIQPFSLNAIVEALDSNSDAIGFSFRLGRNTTYCYMLDKSQRVPQMQAYSGSGIVGYSWIDAECDFGYPLELSSSLYRTADLLPLFRRKEFTNPNTMENCMVAIVNLFREKRPILLCLESSAAFSAPLNLVQTVCDNRVDSGGGFDVESMADAYARGDRLSVEHLMPFTPSACHQEVELRYIPEGEAVPLVSVIIPCYNQSCYLEEAVESVKRQTFRDWEVVIVNDGSPDDTEVVAERIADSSEGSDIRIMSLSNHGISMARNAGIEEARGAYILCLDADDRIASTFLELTLGQLERDRGIGIVYTDLQQFGEGTEFIQAAEFDPNRLPTGNQLNYCSLYRREIWEDVGGYNPNMDHGHEDWNFWVGCVEHGYVAKRIPSALFEYRIKKISRSTGANHHDRELRARIVLNHPSLYTKKCVIRAGEVLVSKSAQRHIPGAPKVSVIIPTCRRPFRLIEALRSVAQQSLQDFEVLVVSDGGCDVRFVTEQFSDSLCIRLFEHAENKGPSAARNTGLRFARGKYVVYLDDDDIFYENHLETLVDCLESTGETIAYTDANCAREVLVNGKYEVESKEVLYSNDWDNDLILARNLVPVLCVMHEVDCVTKSGFFDERLRTHEDWDFWIRLSRDFNFQHLKEVTCEFRQRLDATSLTGGSQADFLRTAEIIMDRYRRYAKGKRAVRKEQRMLLRGLQKKLGIKRGALSRCCLAFVRRIKCLKKGLSGSLVMDLD